MGKWNDYYFNGWHNGLAFYFTPSEPRTFDAFNRSFAPESNYAVRVFKPAEIGELLKKGDIETDPVRLNEYVQGVVRLLHENALTIPVIINYMVGVESPKLKDSGMMDESRTFKVHSTWADAYFIK